MSHKSVTATLLSGGPRRAGLLLAVLVLLAAPALAGEGAPAPIVEVSEFQISYGGVDDPQHVLSGGHAGLPATSELLAIPIRLGKGPEAYVPPAAGIEEVVLPLAELPTQHTLFTTDGLLSLQKQVVQWFHRRGLVGIFVAAHPEDLRGTEDMRPADRKALRLVVWTGVVTSLRTVAAGERNIPAAERVDNPRHRRILANSPVRPYTEGDAQRIDLLRKQQLERYVYRLSRHPGRRVDLSLASDVRPGGVALDYLVNENRPWYVYAQASNTGTSYTEHWRERVGFVHNQLTNRDDVLTLDYVTAGFDEAHALVGSYEAPLFGSDWLRWRTSGSWYEYTASDVGFAASSFDGDGWNAGADLIANIYQKGAFFLDLLLGATYEHHSVTDQLLAVTGEEDLLLLRGGARFERLTETASTWGSAVFEWQGGWTDPDLMELTKLGRFDPDDEWVVLTYDFYHSFYLEPLLFPSAWDDPETPATSTLAHEVVLSVRGQDSLGHRLIPQHESVLGGLHTVRGYPEAVVAGDNMYVATFEYRFHLPRILRPVSALTPEEREKLRQKLPLVGAPFRYRPDNVYGQPDWDLILRVFYDVGRVSQERIKPYEANRTLQGAGFGLELRVKSNVSIRADYGIALDDVEQSENAVESGDDRVHGAITVSF